MLLAAAAPPIGLLARLLQDLPVWFWLIGVFGIGACVGSFLNVCIYRLPLEKSLLWPGSRCGNCYQPIRAYDNIPLISYWLLGGRCRRCGVAFSSRYFFVELLTALSLVGLYYLEVVQNIHQLNPAILGPDRFAAGRLVLFGFHATLLCFLLVATFSDFDHRIIPLSLTITGAIVGLIGALLWPWPWPYTPQEAAGMIGGRGWAALNFRPLQGVYPWPVWGPLPRFLQPGGNWQTGLATGLAGVLVGTLIMRAVRFLFGIGMGAEYMEPEEPVEDAPPSWFGGRIYSWVQRVGGRALGLGDADLMMMVGAFIGWQPVLVAFFMAVFPGLLMAVGYLALRGTNALPFGPALALGVVISFLGWAWIGPYCQPFFFEPFLVLFLVGFCGIFMPLAGLGIRFFRRVRG